MEKKSCRYDQRGQSENRKYGYLLGTSRALAIVEVIRHSKRDEERIMQNEGQRVTQSAKEKGTGCDVGLG